MEITYITALKIVPSFTRTDFKHLNVFKNDIVFNLI